MDDTRLVTLGLLVRMVVPMATFATGLRAREPLWLWRRPTLLARSLFAVLVLVPLAALLIVEALELDPAARAGLIICVVSVGVGVHDAVKRTHDARAPLAYGVSLDVTLLVVAIVYIPTFVALHSALFHHTLMLEPREVAKAVAAEALLPLGLGVAVARAMPRLAAALGRDAGALLNVATATSLAFMFSAGVKRLGAVRGETWLAAALVAVVALAIGHALSASDAAMRRVLAVFSALRFPTLALLLASAVPGGEQLIPTILAYLLTSGVLVSVYGAASVARERSRAEGGRFRPKSEASASGVRQG